MRIFWAAQACADRENIVNFIAENNIAAALKIDRVFSKAVQNLAEFPELGTLGKTPGTREFIAHKNYRLIYEVDADTDTLWVMSIIHTSRLWPPIDS